MKSSQIRLSEARRRDAVAIVEQTVQALFRRMPMVCGFSVRQDLELDDVAVDTWPGYTVGAELYKDLMLALAELAEERPDAIDLLRGRTFARAIH